LPRHRAASDAATPPNHEGTRCVLYLVSPLNLLSFVS
jgi:hypothetical protein